MPDMQICGDVPSDPSRTSGGRRDAAQAWIDQLCWPGLLNARALPGDRVEITFCADSEQDALMDLAAATRRSGIAHLQRVTVRC